jgi:molybdopterin synthase catalytic subunit
VVASVNQALADWRSPLATGDEVAFLPPVSGGSEAAGLERQRQIIEIVRGPIQVAQLVAALKSPEDGAVAVFEGIARNHSGGRRTLHLEYEAYEPMALAKMRDLGAAMRGQFQVDCVALVHRLGRLEIGETSVFIGVSSAHRRAALDACRFGIDTLKRTVPIWKKEFFEDGAVWAEGEVLTPGATQAGAAAPSKSRPPESIS